jgi:diadenosine tetraphosphate (Ap4A) HIT family hydrolase
MSDGTCLFCKIVSGEIPGEFVHQDDRCVVIRDINPQAPTHVLVIPREHIESLNDAGQRDEACALAPASLTIWATKRVDIER